MRLVCDSCKTKYSIADDKVRGKVFKIRCKKCQHVIVVRGQDGVAAQPAAAAAPQPEAQQPGFDEKETRVFDYSGFDTGGAGAPDDAAAAAAGAAAVAPGMAGGEGPVWHVVIDGEQVGPFDEGEVRDRLRRGEIGADTFVWRDGFGDWQRIKVVPDFAEALGEVPETDVARDRPLFAASSAASPSGSLSSAAAEPPFLAAGAASPADVLFGDDGAGADGGQPKLTATRNENSVLFSLSDLQSVAMAGPTPGARLILPSATDSSGLADIRSMAASLPQEQEEDDLVGALSRFSAPSASPVLLAPTVAATPKWLWPAVGGVGGLLVIAIIFLAVLLVRKPEPGPQPIAATSGQAQPAGAAATTPAPAGAAAVGPGTTPGSPEAGTPPGDATPVASAEPAKKSERKGEGGRKKEKKGSGIDLPPSKPASSSGSSSLPAPGKPASKPSGGDDLDALLSGAIKGGEFQKPTAKKGPAGSQASDEEPTGGSNLPDQLTRAQIQTGMAGVKQRVQGCYDQYHVPGIVNVKIVIGGTGRLTSGTVSGKFGGTPTGSCVEKAVKSARFPSFKGPSMNLDYPYVLPIK